MRLRELDILEGFPHFCQVELLVFQVTSRRSTQKAFQTDTVMQPMSKCAPGLSLVSLRLCFEIRGGNPKGYLIAPGCGWGRQSSTGKSSSQARTVCDQGPEEFS